ncbi:hypothetical protein [Rhizobium sp. S163]|uniref:hypothetical protein n=1 Tax=Rhizobium sp. S163 TaxID=3055039 RepID=UPI0025A99D35|nr:hypothetical protein [Rhizobium sp. S163]MDM9643855.1 hypothetical protein [Rhizobium sp. S163]
MECKFHVGQKVVMVNEFLPHNLERAADEGVTLPVIGPIYTVRGMEPGVFNRKRTFIWLDEVRNGPSDDGIEPNWDASQFRAVVERPTDISIFKAMLTPKNEQVPA